MQIYAEGVGLLATFFPLFKILLEEFSQGFNYFYTSDQKDPHINIEFTQNTWESFSQFYDLAFLLKEHNLYYLYTVDKNIAIISLARILNEN